jgi:hypothetical protein
MESARAGQHPTNAELDTPAPPDVVPMVDHAADQHMGMRVVLPPLFLALVSLTWSLLLHWGACAMLSFVRVCVLCSISLARR